MDVALCGLTVADAPEAWRAAGFAVDGEVCEVGSVRIRLVGPGAGRGIVGWGLSGLGDVVDVDGIATARGSVGEAAPSPGGHENGVRGIDHVVVLTPDVERTVTALRGIGLEPRRTREGEMAGAPVRQVFYRLGEVIVEVVGSPDAAGDGPASLWGITFTVDDLDATAAYLGEGLGRVKDAVQPGRRIATLRHRALGISVNTAFLTAPPPR